MTHPKIQRFSRNTVGRDFVTGDIHGAFAEVRAAMKAANFQHAIDRLFVVGDLIDRGADSAQVDEFLALPGVYAVAGNHDRDFTTVDADTIRMLANINFNGLRWAKDLSDQKIHQIQASLAKLPIAMEVETQRGRVGLVHADVPLGMSWQEFVQRVERDDEHTIAVALGQSDEHSRERIQRNNQDGVPGIGRVFVGHTIQWGGARRYGNVYAIDTGAVFSDDARPIGKEGVVTLAHMAFKTESLTQVATKAEPAAKHHILLDIDEEPFGEYCSQK